MTADECADLIERGEGEKVSAALRSDRSLIGLRTSTGETLLHVACRTKMALIVATFIAMEADLNARDRRGRTPLHATVVGGGALAVTIADALLNFGADPTLRDDAGQTVADLAETEMTVGLDELLARTRI
jgi:ankyrin repeat protein